MGNSVRWSAVAPALAVVTSLLVSCRAGSPSAPPPSAPPPSAPPTAAPSAAIAMSSPAEYAERPVSAAAGADYFERLGVGDPYGAGIAYPVLLALMEAYPDVLGRDWNELADRFGFVRDPQANGDPRAPPLEFHLTVDPNTQVPWVVTNCEMCHADRLRLRADGSRDVVVPGLGNKRVRPHAYANALLRAGADRQLDEARLRELCDRRAAAWDIPWNPSMRRAIVRATLAGLRSLAARSGALSERFEGALPGRAATIESFAIALDAFAGAHVPLPDRPGWAKVPDVVGAPYRTTLSFDGSGTGTPEALVLEASFVFGTRPEWYTAHPWLAGSMLSYLRSFRRKLPFPGPIDAVLAERGRSRFASACAHCHGTYERAPGADALTVSYREDVVPVGLVGTDGARVEAVTPAFGQAANVVPLTRGLTSVRNTGGYVPPVLLDVWARGLLGHAGQWPSLEALATPPDERPARFVVDTESPYDLVRVGVAYEVVRAPRALRPGEYLYDGSAPGLGVGGHPFLAQLPADEKRAVIEFLKTL